METDKSKTLRQKKRRQKNEMKHKTVENVCNGLLAGEVKNKTSNNICTSVSVSENVRRGKLASCQNSVFFFP